MRLLLDTHTLLWWLADDGTLAVEARAAIADGDAFVAVSAVSVWEISIKRAAGRLTAPEALDVELARSRFTGLPITVAHALRVADLPAHHGDPFDRMLVAQAELEGLTIVTRDEHIPLYGVSTLLA